MIHMEALKRMPLQTTEDLIDWIFRMKRLVTAKLHRSTQSITKEAFVQRYATFEHTIHIENTWDLFMMMSLGSFDKHATKLYEFFCLVGQLTSTFLLGTTSSLLCALPDASPASVLIATNAHRVAFGLAPRIMEHYDSAR